MAKRHFKGYFETYLVGDESFTVEIRLSPYRRTTSLSLRKSGFVCNAPSRLPKDKIDSFIVSSIPKILSKVKKKPEPIEGDDVYIFGIKTHIEGFSSFSKEKRNRLLKKELLPYVTEMTKEYSAIMGIKETYEVKVRDCHSVYGINHRKTLSITYSLNLVHYDKHIIDSVIVHELTHHIVYGHTEKFYKILLGVAPDYRLSRKKLINHIYA